MSRIAHASRAAAIGVMMVVNISADELEPLERRTCVGLPAAQTNALAEPARAPKRQRIRSMSGTIDKIIDQGYERSPTFRGLVETLEQSPVLVYIGLGRCPAIRQRLNGCLASIGMAGRARYLRILVDVRLPTDTLIATIGHELQHAVEARESSAAADGRGEWFIGAGARPVGGNVYETDEAQDVKEAIRRDLRRAPPG